MAKIKITLPLSEAERMTLDVARAEYNKARDVAWAEYNKARDAAWAEYDKVRGVAWVEYRKARDAAWVEYDKVRGVAGVEYRKARDVAREEYDKACDAARAEHGKAVSASPLIAWIVGTFLGDDYSEEAEDVIRVLIDGATLADLEEMAECAGWCRVWDDALAVAMERFDIVNEQ